MRNLLVDWAKLCLAIPTNCQIDPGLCWVLLNLLHLAWAILSSPCGTHAMSSVSQVTPLTSMALDCVA